MATKGKTRLVRGTGGGMLPWLGLALILLIADQFTKVLVVGYYQLGDSTVVTSFLQSRARAQHRRGVLLPRLGRWLAALVFHRAGPCRGRVHPVDAARAQRATAVQLRPGLHPGGAVGNVIDRVLYGYVVDFLQFHWSWLSPVFPGGFFPAFNIADSAITVGATALILDELLRVRRGR
jgi:signal peptidase II